MRQTWVLGTLATLFLAGCSGDGEAPGWEVSHSELSEISRMVIESVPEDEVLYADLLVDVDGKVYAFGAMASFADRRYQVDGKTDANQKAENGDVLSVPAAGLVHVRLFHMGQELAAFEALVPDNRAPDAPEILEPGSQASGVSRTPTFRWSSVADPSGVSYTLTYSVDPFFQAPVVTRTVEGLTVASYTVPSGNALVAGQTYYWRVHAMDGSDNASPWSEAGEFSVTG